MDGDQTFEEPPLTVDTMVDPVEEKQPTATYFDEGMPNTGPSYVKVPTHVPPIGQIPQPKMVKKVTHIPHAI